jgi:hypothetical protein
MLLWGSDPGDAHGIGNWTDALLIGYTVASRKRGGCRGGAGAPSFFGDATRDQTQRDRPPLSTAFKVRSPNKNLRGPSSTFRRSLLHVPPIPLPPLDALSRHQHS